MSGLKPITLHGHVGPNPWKIALLLEELKIPYTVKRWETPDLKSPEYLALNSKGLSPVIEDPNTNITLAESAAIINYILEQYDPLSILDFDHSQLDNRLHLQEWLAYQVGNHGPTISGIFLFTNVTPNPDARKTYLTRALAVCKVLDQALEGKQWLVGDKCSAADLAYLPHQASIKAYFGDELPDMAKEYPNMTAWVERMKERKAVQKILSERADVFASLQPAK